MFDPKKHLIRVQGNREYLPVAARLVWFRQEHPDWGILTECTHLDLQEGLATFKATIMDGNARVMAQATKMETRKGFPDYLEKAETGAVGRALAMCGFGTQFAPELDEGGRLADSPSGASGTNGHACVVCGATLTQGRVAYCEKNSRRLSCPRCEKQAPFPPIPRPSHLCGVRRHAHPRARGLLREEQPPAFVPALREAGGASE